MAAELQQVTIRVPATTANLGPGFDCLALAFDLWNETTFTAGGTGFHVVVEGEGAGIIPEGKNNLIIQAFLEYYKQKKLTAPAGLVVRCANHIPVRSGLGSSAAAVLTGLLGAQALSRVPPDPEEIVKLACDFEGHPDNAAAAFFGGLTIAIREDQLLVSRWVELPETSVVVVLPEIDLSTHKARAILPATIPFCDAVFNLGRAAMVVEALRTGDMKLLGQCMQDRLHQPHRLKLIAGGEAALKAALDAGAYAAALSGAGPGLVAFQDKNPGAIADAMLTELAACNLTGRSFFLKTTNQGAHIHPVNSSSDNNAALSAGDQ